MKHASPGFFLVIATAALQASAPAAGPDFSRDVRPILSNRCFKCHGPDEENQEAGLRLDLRAAALRELDSGARAIVPGHADASELVARITSDDPDLVMPPPHTKVSLSDDEKRILTAWIDAGAEYAPHWAFVKPVKPEPPAADDETWIRNPIDRFVLARLEAEGLSPAAAADRGTLCRRVHLDLVGLPPSPEELAAFVADPSPDAYEQLVDRLLASPRYGERWARKWLDLARYADTNGYEKDLPRTIWPYRDWVIRALNADMPFDQFTIRQIAGDMLPDAAVDDVVATGFHRNTMLNEEGGIDPLEFRYLAMVDRVGTTGTTWLGLTTACAQCHTHKYDPLTHTDYFALFALLNNADEPEWIIPSAERSQRLAETRAKIESLWKELPSHWPAAGPDAAQLAGSSEPGAEPVGTARRAMSLAERFNAWTREESARAVNWRVVRPDGLESSMPHLVVLDDGSVLASGDQTKSDVYTIALPRVEIPVTAIRLEVLPHESLPAWGPGLGAYEGPKGDFFLSEFEVRVPPQAARIEIAKASESFGGTAAHSKEASGAAAAIDGVMSSGWSTNGRQGRGDAAVFELAQPVAAGEPIVITMRFERHFACPLGRFRLSVTDAEGARARGHSAEVEAALAKAPAARSADEHEAILRRFLSTAPEVSDHVKEIERLEASLREGLTTLVLQERPTDNPRPTRRHHRGEFTQPKEEVAPAVPAFLPPLPGDAPADRLALARWLVASDNPLTARVTVNRQWQAFFGRGIVATVEDFGYQGGLPSHPELLDWLAVSFQEPAVAGGLGWSLKKLHRLIVTSATYRQASTVTSDLADRDPQNVLLARGPRVRLDAEIIRDSMLASAGLLSTKMYGPGVRPPQPAGVTEVAYGAPKWEPSQGEDRYRRGIYTFQKRTAPFAFTTTFDGPTGEACIARREVSNSPLQALTLLNDPMFLEIAQALGRQAAAAGPDDASRFDLLARRLFSRSLAADEAALLAEYLAAQRGRLAAGELDAAKLAGGETDATVRERAAWTLVARALMNLDEAIVKR
ncbi:MAG: PSD1 and planctomycete cytochrome C domain-containing protein [Planctomycetota bacterium]